MRLKSGDLAVWDTATRLQDLASVRASDGRYDRRER